VAKWPYNGPWPKIRLQILERDGQRCQIRLPKCLGAANQVDHKVPVEQGGAPYDPDNLRAACRPCNVARRNTLHNTEGWRTANTKVTLVYGPPGAGKSTYVQQHRQPGDLIVDYDLIGNAMGSDTRAQHQQLHTTINAARNAILAKIRAGETGAPHVWIVSTNPKATSLFPHHDAIHLDPGQVTTTQRAIEGGRTPSAVALIDQWYTQPGRPSRDW
jgi:hypothetical protein